jgi:hypothetical protein
MSIWTRFKLAAVAALGVLLLGAAAPLEERQRPEASAAIEDSATPEQSVTEPTAPPQHNPNRQNLQNNPAQEEPEPWPWHWVGGAESALAWLTLALVFGTFALAFYTANLWLGAESAARKQRRADRKAHERELRAYINIASARIIHSVGGAHPWVSRIEFRNYGKTPANDVRIFGVLELMEWPLDETKLKPINADDPDASRFTLGPTAGRTKIDPIWAESAYEQMFGADYDAMKSATYGAPCQQMLVAHGAIHYVDAFGQARVTNYRYFVGGREGLNDEVIENGKTSYRMAAHSSGNDAT